MLSSISPLKDYPFFQELFCEKCYKSIKQISKPFQFQSKINVITIETQFPNTSKAFCKVKNKSLTYRGLNPSPL